MSFDIDSFRPLRCLTLALLLATVTACDDDAQREPDGRSASRTDTIRVEGMTEPVQLRLFRTPDGFPLPFTAYVPAALEPTTDTASIHFRAAFAGVVEPDAFLHLSVFPAGTDRQAALAHAKGYKTGRGIPVSQGLEPIAAAADPDQHRWAIEAYRFRYQSAGAWFAGTVGVGYHGDRHFMLVRHYPVEYAEGFAPRADIVLETLRWADGTGLRADGR